MKKVFHMLLVVIFMFQLFSPNYLFPQKVQAASNVNAPAEFLIPGAVQTTGVEPLGANLGSITGANNFAINNEVSGSGFEPIVVRNLERVDRFGSNWFEWDGHGGISNYDQKWTGYLNGAEIRFYRLVNPSGSPLPYTNGNIDVTNANNVSYIGKASIPTPCAEFAQGGFICNKFTNPGNVPLVKYNNSYTDKTNMTNGKTFYYVVQAVDAKGNKSVNSNEASVAPMAGANNGPHIYGLSTLLSTAVGGTAYNHQLAVTGGTAPYTWTVIQGVLPAPLTLNPSTGLISGTPVTTPPETSLKIKVTDSKGLFDIKDYKLNPVADVVDSGDVTAPQAPTNVTATSNDGAITLNWTPSTSNDTVGYQVLVSDTPGAQQMARVYIDKSDLNLKQGDYAFIYKKTGNMPAETTTMRLTRSNAGGDVFSYDKNFATLSRVAHPGTIPPAFSEPGETCLEVDAKAGSISLGQYKYFPYSTTNGEAQWYSQLRPGAPYKVEVWMRQDSLSDGGKVKFEFNGGDGAYSSASQVTPWTVTNTWQKYTYEFTGPAYPTSGWHISFGFKFTGPGKLYMDNFLMYRNDAVHNYKPFTPQQVGFDELMDSMPSSGKKPSIRFYSLSFNDSTMDAQTSNYASSSYGLGWAPSTGSASNMTIAQSMDWAYKTGTSPLTRAVPYFTVPVDYYENEWKGLIEYLGVPYDPLVDTPSSKPFAYKRYVQRGNNGTPWTQEFREIMLELGNETWHNGWMESWDGFGAANAVTAGGKEYGLFAKYIFNDVIGGMPAWTSNNLNSKIKFSLGAFYNWQTDSYGELATQQGANVSYLGHANYVGPKWETGDSGESTFNDHGVQETLVGMVTGVKAQIDGTASVRDLLNSTAGTNYQLQAYEGGPSGYSIYGVSDTSENYGKSEAMGLAALDTWLYSSYKGYKSQNYLGYGSGSMWSSHMMPEAGGFAPHPGWLALKMRNKYATGDNMLQTVEYSNPTYNRVGADVPLTSVYSLKDDSSNYSVFVLNRKLAGVHDGTDFGDGYTPVKLRLPFVNPTSVKVYKLSHADGTPVNPAENNRATQKVFITQKTINPSNFSQIFNVNETTGAYAQGIEPGGVYLYVFSGGTQATTPPTPTPSPTPIPTPTPTPIPTPTPDISLVYGPELVVNGQFTTDKAGWDGVGILSNADPIDGNYVEQTGTKDHGTNNGQKILGVELDANYELSFDYKGGYRLWFGANDYGPSEVGLDNTQGTSDVWTKKVFNFTCSDNGEKNCYLSLMAKEGNSCFYDNVSLRKVTDTDATPSPTPAPIATPNLNPISLVSNGSFVGGLTGWENQNSMGSLNSFGLTDTSSARIGIAAWSFFRKSIAVEANTKYFATFYTKGTGTEFSGGFDRNWADSSFVAIRPTVNWVKNTAYIRTGNYTSTNFSVLNTGGFGYIDIDNISVYKVSDASTIPTELSENLGPNLMYNAGFENIDANGIPVGWGTSKDGRGLGVNGSVGLRFTNPDSWNPQHGVDLSAFVGKTLRMTMKVKALRNKRNDVEVFDINPMLLRISGANISTDVWTTLSFDYTVTADYPNVTFGFYGQYPSDVVVDDLAISTILGEPYVPTQTPTPSPTPTPTPSGHSVTLTSLSAADRMNTGDNSYDAYMNANGKTTVTIKNSYKATSIIATKTIDPATKSVTFTGLTSRDYVVSVSRNGYLVRNIRVTAAGADVNLGNKSLIAGDVFVDGIIDGSDSESLFSEIGHGYGITGYVPSYDLSFDGTIDGTDTEMLFANIGLDVGAYGESVDYYN